MDTSRDTLFISHANPADNQFTAWLASRLSIMGYKVWADLENLKGGNKHWQVIEDIIRNKAAKVLVVTTKASRKAEGVEQEINIAKGIEKENGLDAFIIQLKVDDLPYTQLPPALNNRLAISFTNNWGKGLKNLVDQLDDENTPKPKSNNEGYQFSKNVLEQGNDRLVEQDEPVFATWLPLTLPSDLYFYEFPSAAKTISDLLISNGVASSFFKNYVLTFAVPDTVAYITGNEANRLRYKSYLLQDWIEERNLQNNILQRKDRRSTLTGLLNTAWELFLEQHGLSAYHLSNEKAYFYTTENDELVKQPYIDPLGRRTRPITLVGKSSKNASFWHAAMSTRAFLKPFPHFSCRLHVAFTDDGQITIANGEKAFQLRRSFCKQWWNDRWRRIFFAFLARLSDDDETLVIPSGGEKSITVENPIELISPYSIASDVAQAVSEEVEDALPPLASDDEIEFVEDRDDED